MKKFTVLSLTIIITSVLNYSCEHLCEDENSSRDQKENTLQKEITLQEVDTLNGFKID